jgi:hypothetical protein
VINGLKREELVAMNSMVLHELYFDGLGGASMPKGTLVDAIMRDFGSFEKWKAQFSAMGKAIAGGSGWVQLSWSPRDKWLVNQWAADHTTTIAVGSPVIPLVSSTLGTSPEQRSGTITQDRPSRKSSTPRTGIATTVNARSAMRFRQQQQDDDHQPEGGGAADRVQQIEGHVSPPASFRRAALVSQPSRTTR